jgi:hypothetical protein
MYIYLLDKSKKEVIELKQHSDIVAILGSLGIKYYEEFPYAAAGYEDPYEFMDNYKLIKLKSDKGVLFFEEEQNV